MKRTALMLLGLLPLAATLLPLGSYPQDPPTQQNPAAQQDAARKAIRTATVLFVRHAEARPRTKNNQNPDLSDPGTARAKQLAQMLRAAGVTRIFATELTRTQQTAQPLAKQLGLQLEQYEARQSQAFAKTLRDLPNGAVAMVVGHSNTVPLMVRELGGSLQGLDQKGYLQETEHDRVIVQVLSAVELGTPMRAVQTLDLRMQ